MGGITIHGTSGSGNYRVVIVTLSGDNNGIAADLMITYGTVNYAVVRTCFLTIGVLVVLGLSCACGVTLSGDLIGTLDSFVTSYSCASVGYVTVLCTGGRCYCGIRLSEVVTELFNYIRNVYIAAS